MPLLCTQVLFLSANPDLVPGSCLRYSAPSCPSGAYAFPLFETECTAEGHPNIVLSQAGRPTATTLLTPADGARLPVSAPLPPPPLPSLSSIRCFEPHAGVC